MISVYFNTTLDGYCQDELSSSDCFEFSSFTGKKIVSSEVLLTHIGFNLRPFPFDVKFLIASSKNSWVMSV